MKKIYLFVLLVCLSIVSFGQTVLLSPTGDGGFETGNTFALNNWTAVNSGTTAANNPWVQGTSSVFAGTYGVYIGPSNNPSNNSRRSHFYRNVTIPAGATGIKLSFYLKEPNIDDTYDFINVYTTSSTTTPVAGTTPGGAYTSVYSNTANAYSSFTLQTVTLPNTLAGTTFRIVFTYINDGVSPAANPQVDNIQISYCPQATSSASATPTSLCAGASLALAGSVAGATSYSWAGPSSYTSTLQNPSFATAANSGGIYTVTGLIGTCSYTAATSAVSITPLPGAITGTAGMCIGSSTSLFCTPTGGTWSSGTTSVATVNASTGQVFGVSGGTSVITYTTSCGSSTITATVASAPTAIGGSFTRCLTGGTTTLTNGVAGGTWVSTNPAVATITASGMLTPVAQGVTTISYTSCSNSVTQAVTINANPAAVTGTPASICIGGNTTYANTSTGGTWSSSNTAVATVDPATGVVTGVAQGTANISYSNGCGSATFKAVAVNANPATMVPASATICQGTSTTLTNASTGGTWTSANTGIATVSASGMVTGVAQGTTTISYNNSCGTTATATINVNPIPGTISASATSLCVGTTVTVSNPASSGLWSSSNPAIATVNGSGLVTGLAGGTVTITYNTSCGTPATIGLSVNAAPAAINPLSDVELCIGLSTTLSNSSLGGVWSSSATGVATVNTSTGVVGGVSAGTATITYDNGCGAPTTRDVIVNTPPNATITGTSPVCQATNTTLANTVAGGTWYSSNTSIATIDAVAGTVGGVAGGSATITYLVSGCNPATRSIAITPIPATITGFSILCPSTSTTLANTVAGGTWTSSDPSIATISAAGVVGATVTPGTTTITYSNGCAPDATKIITVSGTAGPITGSFTLCAPAATTLFAENWESGVPTTPGTLVDGWDVLAGSYNSYLLTATSFTDPVLAATPTGGLSNFLIWNSFNTSGSATIVSPSFSLNNIAGGTLKFWVYRENTDYTGAAYATEGFNVYINTSASLSGGTLLGFVPRRRNGAISGTYITGTSTTTTSGWYQYTCTMPPGYTGGTNYILVNAVSAFGNNCYMDNMVMTGTLSSSTALANATPGGTWATSATSIVTVNSATGLASSVAAGTATITYNAPCGAPITQSITVNPLPGAFTGSTTICQSTTTTWTNSAGSGTWSSSNTSVASVNASTGAITGIGGGTATITFINGCGNPATRAITITATPSAITGATALCPGGSGILLNSVSGGTWTSGTPSVATVNSTTGAVGAVASSGTTIVTYSNGCLPNATATITVSGTPAPITGTLTLCPPPVTPIFSQDFEVPAGSAVPETSTPVNGWFQINAPSFSDFYTLDAASSFSPSISAAQSGTYFMDYDYFGTTGTVSSPAFDMTPYSGAKLTFWVYRDGAPTGAAYAAEGFTMSINTSPTLTGATTLGFVPRRRTGAISGAYLTGTSTTTVVGWYQYTITLPPAYNGPTNYLFFTATSAGGNDCYMDNIVLTPTPFTSTLTSATPGGTWTSSNTSVATITAAGVVTALTAGTTTISYTTACGAVGTTVTVNPAPGAIGGTLSICPGTTTSLTNIATGGTWSSSNTAIASINAATGVATGIAPGTATITYASSCGVPSTTTLTVKSLPATITGATSLCPSTSGTLFNTTTGGTWTSSSPSVASVNTTTGAITAGATPGTATITYSNGCAPNATATVTVSSTTAPIVGGTSICAPSGTIATILSQNFNSGLTGAVGGTWTITNTGASSPYNWNIFSTSDWSNVDVYGDGTPFIGANADAAGSGVNLITKFTSPAISTVGMGSANLAFNYYCESNTTYDVTAQIEYSTNGTTWTTLYDYLNTTTGSVTWSSSTPTQTIALPAGALGQPVVYIRWNWNSTYGFYWAVDNIVVSGPRSPFVTLTDATPGGTWSSSNTAVATVSSVGNVVAVAAGNTTITYTGPCGSPVTQPITVNPVPGTIGGAGTFCMGTSISLTNTAPSGTWTSSNTAVASVNSATGVVSGITAGTATITYSTGCGTDVSTTVTVKAPPAAIVGATSLCPSTSTFLTNTVTGGTWTSSNTAVATINPTSGNLGSTATPGTTTITYGNGCAPNVTSVVVVSSSTDTIAGAYYVCAAPSPLVYTSFEAGVPSVAGSPVDGWNYIQGTGAANNYWTSIAGSSTANPSAGGTPSGGGSMVAQFSSKTITAGNTAALVSPSFSLAGGNGGRVSFYFYRDNTAGVANNYDSVAVYVNTTPAVGGSWIGSVCRSTTRTTAYTGTAVSSGWFKYTYSIPASFAGATNYIVIKGYSAAGNNMYLDSVLIRNNSSVTTFTNATSGGAWSSSAPAIATISSTGVITAISAGTANITYTGACGTPATHPITVNPVPGANTFGSTTICVGATTTVANATAGGTWSSVNPAIATVDASGNVTGLSAGIATISYFGGCGAAATTSIIVNPLPTIASVTASSTSLCAGAPLTLTAGAASGTGGLIAYNWSGPAAYSTTGITATDVHTVASSAATGVYSLTVTYPGLGCTSAAAVTGAVTVNDYPVAYNVTGGNGCSAAGITVGLDGSQSSAVSYALRLLPATTVATVTGTNTTLSFGAATAAGVYVVIATGPGSCQTLMNGSDTVNTTPAITVGTSPSICQPTTSASVSYTLPVGSPVTYNLDWSSAANTAGFTDVAGNVLSGSSITLVVPASGAIGNFTGDLTVSNGACTSAPYTTGVTVYATPIVPVITVTNPCVNYIGGVNLTGVDGSVVDYTVDGGTVSTFTFAGTTHTISTGNITTPHIYAILNAHNPVCTTPIDDTVTVTPVPMAWLGGAAGHESDWNEGSNWTCGFPPSVSDDASISSTVYAPAIPASISVNVNDLTLNAPSIIVLNSGSVLNVKGNVLNTSTISGNGKVILSGAVQQLVKGIGTISNLELNNASGAKVDTASRLMISNALTITSGVLNTNDSLELLSLDTAATARIAPLPTSSSIVGRVKTDQYVQGGFRRYRLWSHSFSDTMSLMQIQQFIDITGAGGSANGFVPTASNAPSAFRYDPLVGNAGLTYDTGWKAITKIDAGATDENMLHPGQGLRLFVRGLKNEGLGYAGYYGAYTPSPSTVKMMGHVNQGPVSIRLAKGTVDPTNQDYNLVGNPYPSPVDIGSIATSALAAHKISGSAFYLWIASTPGGGQWNLVPIGSPYYIGAHVGFEVRADHDGATLDFVESDKASSVDNYLFKAPAAYTTLSVYDSNNEMWDMLRINFTDAATDNEDRTLDATKPMGTNFGFYSMSPDGRRLGIDARPYGADKVIPLGVHSTYQQDFVIRATNIAIPKGGSVYLHDKLLGKVVEMQAGSEYKFTIGKDKATQGEDRFELSTKPAIAATAKGLSVNMTPNPATDDVKINFTSGKKDVVSVRVLDMSGVSIYSQDLGTQQNGMVSVPLSSFAAGIYMVELTQGSQKVTQKLVKE